MRPEITRQLDEMPADSEIERQRDQEMIQNIMRYFPQVANEVREEGRRQALQPQFEHRLRRPLAEHEAATLAARIGTLGHVRVGEVVLDLDAEALARSLAEPDAR